MEMIEGLISRKWDGLYNKMDNALSTDNSKELDSI